MRTYTQSPLHLYALYGHELNSSFDPCIPICMYMCTRVLVPLYAAIDMSMYIRNYARYLKTVCHVYRQITLDVMKVKRG